MILRAKVLWFVIFTVVGGGILACREESQVVTASEELMHLDADAIVMGGEHTFTNEEGLRSAYLAFDTAYQWRDSVNTALRGVDLTVFNRNGSERARITSVRGTLDPRGERMTAQGNVVLIVPEEDRRLESGELNYDPQVGQIWSDSSFVMTHEGQTLSGASFTSDLEFRNFQARGTGGQ